MNRRAVLPLASCLLPIAFAACATQASPPPAQSAAPAQPAAERPPASESAAPDATASPRLLAPVPQPPERPVAPEPVTDPAIPRAQRIENFIDYAASTYGVDAAAVRATLAGAQVRQSILEAMSRPAEKTRTWAEYRPIFVNDARISGGRAFYAQHREALERVSEQTGVPAEYIVAIIGVETSYGRITGNYRVLDALYTLAFDFPRRAPFFAGELAQLFALADEEPQLDIPALKGSYAGAMGMGQFMPSSYRLWAADGDGDGRRDLLTHLPDVFASIANYFVVHGWERGGPVVARATRDPAAEDFVPDGFDPVHPLTVLAARGYRPQPGEPVADGATLVSLEGEAGPEYWLGYRNFYVITRYNRSPMYSLAVHQLAQSIRAGAGAGQ
ncbi:lytic murein transglycosylase B [Luteimonas sp. RD2P54]|uniref:Lytic murein transglycosylase B n=1 Tax=Luteimonas endophytica TaxID=3042023 RepID=A0ABT6JCZ6_9GAMM|nr:lytic murein transglycosylase B [Luteimonas endophytica]MDH5824696.1 lytic murein transglycosylase B [Luteimonas endophytica]